MDSCEKEKDGEKKEIELGSLKHTLNNSCYSSGKNTVPPFSGCASIGLTEIAHHSQLLIFTMGVCTSDTSGKRHQRRWLLQ